MATCMPTMVAPADTSEPNHQYVCLKCKHQSTNKQTMLVNFLNQEKFCDVTLVCEGKLIFAHKVILAMCSSYFQNILTVFEKRDPIVIFKDIKHSIMTTLVDFMYKGELFVQQGLVVDILEAAKVLKINGLLEGDDYQISECEVPRTETVAENINVVETNLCSEVPKVNPQTVSPKKRKLAGLHRKRIRKPMSKKRRLVRNMTDGNDDGGADSTEELLKVAENVFQQLNDVRDKNKALFLSAQRKSCVQEADENSAPMFHKGKSNLICRQSEDSSEDCQEYDSSSSSTTETPNVNSLVQRNDHQEKETKTMHSENVDTTCNVNSTSVNLGRDKENESNIINKDNSNVDGADDLSLHISEDDEENDITNNVNKEHSNVDSADDLSLHISKDYEESESNTNNKELPKQSLKVEKKPVAKGQNVVLKSSDDQSENNSQSLKVRKKPGARGRNVVLKSSYDQSVNNTQSLKVRNKPGAKGRNVVLKSSDDQSENNSQSLKVKKKPRAKGRNVVLKSSDDQSVNNDLPCVSGALRVVLSKCDDSHEKSVESKQIRKSFHSRHSNCGIDQSMTESGREQVRPNTGYDTAGSGKDSAEETSIYQNSKQSKSEMEKGQPSKKQKLNPKSIQSTSESGNKKVHPLVNNVKTGKMLESQTTSNKKQPEQKKVKTSKGKANRPDFTEGVIPLKKYLSKPGNSKEGFWKECWAMLIVQGVCNKKLGKAKASHMLGVDSKLITEQVCLRKQCMKPKPLRKRTKKKPPSKSHISKALYDSTDYDSGEDSNTLSNKDNRSRKIVKHTAKAKLESSVPFSFSDLRGESSDSWDPVDGCLSIVDESETNHASVTVKPAPLTCTLNLKPVPVLQINEYSDDDVSQESSGISEDLNLM